MLSERDILTAAKRYTTRQEWRKADRSSYGASCRHGADFHDKACAHMPEPRCQSLWTDEALLKSAKRYKTRGAWMRKAPNAYNTSTHRGKAFHAKACRHMKYSSFFNNPPPKPHGYWTQKRVIAEGRKYRTTGEWRKRSMSSYLIAYRNGWHKGVIKLTGKNPSGRAYWTDAVIIKYLTLSPRITDIQTWKALHPVSFRIATKRRSVSFIATVAL